MLCCTISKSFIMSERASPSHVLCSHDVLPSFWYRREQWCSKMRPTDEKVDREWVLAFNGRRWSNLYKFFFSPSSSFRVSVITKIHTYNCHYLPSYARSIHSNVWTFQCSCFVAIAVTTKDDDAHIFYTSKRIFGIGHYRIWKRNPLCVVARYVQTHVEHNNNGFVAGTNMLCLRILPLLHLTNSANFVLISSRPKRLRGGRSERKSLRKAIMKFRRYWLPNGSDGVALGGRVAFSFHR